MLRMLEKAKAFATRKQALYFLLTLGFICLLYKVTWTGEVTELPTSHLTYPEFHEHSYVEQSLMQSNSAKYTTDATTRNEIVKAITSTHKGYTQPFDINSTDIMVFLHIQKTGGTTFGRHLIHDLDTRECVKKPNRLKAYECLRPTDDTEWLFSRYTSGWRCGVHADWTSLTECVEAFYEPLPDKERRFFYITFLRHPVDRFLSEWAHVARGATWVTAYLKCNGKIYDYPLCWEGENWQGVLLDEFIACEDNMANNRQTRMLANLREINCTETGMTIEERDHIILESAKRNLQDMEYFGLMERQRQSQIMFEKTFNLNFKTQFSNMNATHVSKLSATSEQLEKIKALNVLDVELYDFAVELFERRVQELQKSGVEI